MNKFETIAHAYSHALANNDYAAIVNLFATDGVVSSPTYGNMAARDFYDNLFKKEVFREARIKNIFRESNDPNTFALHLFLKADFPQMPNVQVNDCIDILKVNDEGKISLLTIIFDTYPVRSALKK